MWTSQITLSALLPKRSLVNALIHRDYIVLGSEIHIDMYDDRVEIISPGGMFEGSSDPKLGHHKHSFQTPKSCAGRSLSSHEIYGTSR